jgi:O-antigen/teichoic acid export membrane protein
MPSLFKNASWGGISAAIRLVFGMANLFLAIRLVGSTAYGYIALMFSVAMIYLTFINSIHTIAVTHAAELKKSDTSSHNELLKLFSAVWIFTVIACVFITALAFIFGDVFIHNFVYWGNNQALSDQLSTTLLLVLNLLILQLLNASNVAIIESLGRFDLAAKAQVFGPVLAFFLYAAIFVISKTSLIHEIVLIAVLAALLDVIFTTIVRWKMGYLSAYMPQESSLKLIPTLFEQGLSLQGSRLVNVFVDPFNKYLLNLFAGPASVTVYEVVMKVITGIQGLFGGAFRTFLQLTNEMRNNSGQEYIKSLRYGLLPALLLHAIAGVIIIYVNAFWFSKDTALLPTLLYLMIPASTVIIFIAPLYFALIGIRDLKFIFQMNLNLAILNIIGSLIFIPLIGVLGCAIGFSAAIFLNALLEYRRYVAKVGNISELGKEMNLLKPKLILITAMSLCSLIVQQISVLSSSSITIQTLILISLTYMLLKEPLAIRMFERLIASRPMKI